MSPPASTADVAATARRDEIGRLLTSLATMQTSLRSRAAQAGLAAKRRTATAEALRQTNLRFDTALNNMSHGLMMCDADGRIVVVNRRFCELYGIDPARIAPGAAYRDLCCAQRGRRQPPRPHRRRCAGRAPARCSSAPARAP